VEAFGGCSSGIDKCLHPKFDAQSDQVDAVEAPRHKIKPSSVLFVGQNRKRVKFSPCGRHKSSEVARLRQPHWINFLSFQLFSIVIKWLNPECDFTHIFADVGTIILPEQKSEPLILLDS
jgi:hypothetical protein